MSACIRAPGTWSASERSEEHTSELQSQSNLVCRLLLEKKKNKAVKSLIHLTPIASAFLTTKINKAHDIVTTPTLPSVLTMHNAYAHKHLTLTAHTDHPP